jgi:hypothetical protein
MKIMIKLIDIEGQVVHQKPVDVLTINTIGNEISIFLKDNKEIFKNGEVVELEMLNDR